MYDSTVENELDCLQGAHFSSGVIRIADAVTSNSDVGAVGVIFLWADFTHNPSVCHITTAVMLDVVIQNSMKCVCASMHLVD